MEFVNGGKPNTVEIHVKMTREELEHILYDMSNVYHPYGETEEFVTYLKGL